MKFLKGKKLVNVMLVISMMTLLFTGCASGDKSASINVITREQGSGTRSAFVEITGILEKSDDGEEKDLTSEEATVQNNTEAVMTAVGNDKNAIGYISLGSLKDSVKAIKIDGVEPTAENIKSGDYKIQRPFNVVYKDGASEGILDFLKFIESDEGQKIVEEEGYIPDTQGIAYEASDNSETITIAGSTSVTPLMEKLAEAYVKYNPNFKYNLQATGSSAGVQSAKEGSAEIGMVSRELKDSEKDLQSKVIARDGIVVIGNLESPVEDLTLEEVKNIFTGETTTWE
ncbi:substrate-binding domain-containing protein [Anaerosphaera multitolerans]|uniref:Phosphate ABC transporter substrate-binding protein n=1 Tax=Anaerosphaera multitolerans TaxID=2487351 RepID=A0A437S4V0_9FIRM|nr:substrate-binding domain-containing protein [Anaerosphaera multitolerans]RVU54062.1 phosphate ABC transporter substrate-binding protein [Anaerosphaera multitolerans]